VGAAAKRLLPRHGVTVDSPRDLDEYKRVTENVSIDEFAKKFGESKAPRMLKALKAAQGVKPTMSDDGSKATIEFKEPVEGKDKIEFIKIDKLWYIKG
jgi:hypothetical protein